MSKTSPDTRHWPCGPGKPLEGQPNGCPSVPSSVYSCSIPNHGWLFSTMLMICLQVWRRLVSVGTKMRISWNRRCLSSTDVLLCLTLLSEVLTCWLAVVLEHLAEHQLVGVFPERVPEHGCRDQEHVTVGALRLVGAGAVEVPLRKIWHRKTTQVNNLFKNLSNYLSRLAAVDVYIDHTQESDLTLNLLGLKIQSFGLASQSLSRPVNPDVHGLDLLPLSQIHVLLLNSFIQFRTRWGCHFPDPKTCRGKRADVRASHRGVTVWGWTGREDVMRSK